MVRISSKTARQETRRRRARGGRGVGRGRCHAAPAGQVPHAADSVRLADGTRQLQVLHRAGKGSLRKGETTSHFVVVAA